MTSVSRGTTSEPRSTPLIEVTSVHKATDVLKLNGKPRIGEEIELHLESPNGN